MGILPLGIGGVARVGRTVDEVVGGVARQLQDPPFGRFDGQRQRRSLLLHVGDDRGYRFGHRARRRAALLYDGGQYGARVADVGEVDDLRPGTRPRFPEQPSLVQRRLLPPLHHRHVHAQHFAAVGLRHHVAQGQQRRTAHYGLGAVAHMARLVQAGRQAVRLQHQGDGVGQPYGGDQVRECHPFARYAQRLYPERRFALGLLRRHGAGRDVGVYRSRAVPRSGRHRLLGHARLHAGVGQGDAPRAGSRSPISI